MAELALPHEVASGRSSAIRTHSRLLHGGREAALSARHHGEHRERNRRLDVLRDEASRSLRLVGEAEHPHTARANYGTWLRDELMAAIERTDLPQIDQLVRQGAPLQPRYRARPDPRPMNPVDWATLHCCFRSARKLVELGKALGVATEPATRRAVSNAAEHGDEALVRSLVEGRAHAGQVNTGAESALHVAVRRGHSAVAATLLQHGAWSVEAKRREVLDAAAESGELMLHVLDGAGVPRRVPGTQQQPWPEAPESGEWCSVGGCQHFVPRKHSAEGHGPLRA